MSSFVENNKDKFCSVIFSIIYLVKSLRNTNIKNVEYIKNLEYVDKNFKKKIHLNGEIIYVKNLDEKTKKIYGRSQKWIIVQFYDYKDEGGFMYEIEPYFENKIITGNNKILISQDKIVDQEEDILVDDINSFREKYENSFLMAIIYLCFINCISIIEKKNKNALNTIMNSMMLDKLVKKIIDLNKSYFDDLNFDASTVLPSINNIIKNIQINILKIFNVQSADDLICDLSKSENLKQETLSNVTNFTTNYNIQFVKNENYNSNKLNTDLSSFYDSHDIFKLPEFPSRIKIKYVKPYKNKNESEQIDLFNVFYRSFKINSDAMLSVLRYNSNAVTNSIITYKREDSYKSQLTGLTPEEIKNMNNVPNDVRFKELLASSGGKKSKKNKHIKGSKKSKKIYKGGIVENLALIMANKLVEGAICYLPTTDAAIAMSQGLVQATGGGMSYIDGAQVIQVVVNNPVVATAAAGIVGSAATVTAIPAVLVGAAIIGTVTGLYGLFGGGGQEISQIREGERIAREAEQANAIEANEHRRAERESLLAERENIREGTRIAEEAEQANAIEANELRRGNREIREGRRIAREAEEANAIEANEHRRAERDSRLAERENIREGTRIAREAEEANAIEANEHRRAERTEMNDRINESRFYNPAYRSTFKALETSENPDWGLNQPSYDNETNLNPDFLQNNYNEQLQDLPQLNNGLNRNEINLNPGLFQNDYDALQRLPQNNFDSLLRLPQLNTNNNYFLLEEGEQSSIPRSDFNHMSSFITTIQLGVLGIQIIKSSFSKEKSTSSSSSSSKGGKTRKIKRNKSKKKKYTKKRKYN
jgi:hypothetical protein